MQTITANEARTELQFLIDKAARTHEPIAVTGASHNTIIVAQKDWEAIQETLTLLAIPGMRESIRDGLTTPLEECIAEWVIC